MRRLIVVLGVLLIFNSCHKKERLSGLWIGAYRMDVKSSAPASPYPSIRILLHFKGDQAIFKSLDLPGEGFGDDIIVNYNYIDGIIAGDSSETFKIESQRGDSLILVTNGDKIVFKKFEQSPSPNHVKLTGKAFLAFHNNYADSIDFVNDSLLFHLNREPYKVVELWAVKEFEGYKFLLLGQFSPLLFIESTKSDSIYLKNFGVGSKQITLIKLKERKASLSGSWEEVYRIYDDPDFPPPPIKNNRITFYKDSLQLKRGGNVITRKWKLNSTSEILFFPDRIFKEDDWAWRIIHNRGDSLVVDRRILSHNDLHSPKETVVFKRVHSGKKGE